MTAIDVHKQAGGRYHSVLHRADGVLVRLEGGSYNRIGGGAGRVPHDVAHLVVEDAFGLERGLWGVLAAGGLVQNASFAGGRLPPHAERRARAVPAPAREALRQAEVLVRAVADATLEDADGDLRGFERRVGERWRASITADALARACTGLRDAARRWDALAAGDALRLAWPGAALSARRRSSR